MINMKIELALLIYATICYFIGYAIGFFGGREYERYKNKKDIWDQDAH